MKKIYALLFITILILSACNSHKQDETNKIESLVHTENNIIQLWQKIDSLNSVGIIDTTLISNFLQESKLYADKNPESPNVPNILLNAGQLTMVLSKMTTDPIDRAQHAKNAIDIFNKFEKIYPENPNIKYCYFHRGTIYDDILEDYRSAEIEFRELIHRFPNDSLAINVNAYIKHLGKTPEEIMATIEEQRN